MNIRDEIDALIRQNQALAKTLANLSIRLDSALKLLSAITGLTALPAKRLGLPEAAGELLTGLMREVTDVSACSLLLYDQETGLLKLLEAKGQADLLGETDGPYHRDLTFRPGEGIAGRAFQTGETIFWDRESRDGAPLVETPGLTTPASLASMPLNLPEGPIGVLNISFGTPQPFGLPRRRDLTLLGKVVANIVQTFLLRGRVDEKADFLERKVDQCEREISERKRVEDELRRTKEGLEENVRKRTSDLEAAYAKLKKSETRYRELFESINDFIFSHDLEGRFLDVNPAMAEALGYQTDEMIGVGLSDLMKPNFRQSFREDYLARIGKGRLSGVMTIRHRDGSEKYIEYRSTLVRGDQGLEYVSGTGRDATDGIVAQRDLRTLEEQLTQSQKMEAVGTLASGIAHDFNNILQAVAGYIQLLLTKENEPDVARRYLTEADQAIKRAGDMVRRLLTFSRKVDPELAELDLNQQVYQAVRMLERTIPRMILIETYLEKDLQPIDGDANQLEQVLMNLGTNARDAMTEGGRIVIETANVVLGEEEAYNLLDLQPGRYVRLKFSDTGIGMDEETARSVFDPFFTTKEPGEGTGLGLSTVYGIVKGHGGHIRLETRPGAGATFEIYLPALPGRKTVPATGDNTVEELPGGFEKIMLVDDERAILEVAKSFLERYGYRTVLAEGGEKALEIYRELQDEIDLIVLDLGMPGMGGHSCLKQILNINPGGKVIVATGYSTKKHETNAIESGAKGFIAKPYKLTQLLKVIRKVLDG